MNLLLPASKAWYLCRTGVKLMRAMPSISSFLFAEIEKQRTIARINARFQCDIHREALLSLEHEEDFVAARGVVIGAFTVVCVLNESKKERNSYLTIGESTYINEQNNIRACGGRVSIGKKCLISQQVSIIASNHQCKRGLPIQDQPWDQQKTGVWIGDDVWIGCGVQILPGATIGNGAVVAAGSVVNSNVPENTIVAGVPAREIRKRE
ncbi:MAG TPA: acyltransferase [Candidatus Paceibacterota bacterium]|nr:acyltransferase [Candidatus Paceibacterota bacterium]